MRSATSPPIHREGCATSLLEHIPEEDRDFSDVWRTHALPDGVYFQTYKRLFRWQGGQMKVWRPPTEFDYAFALHDTLYVGAMDVGLLRIDQDTLVPAPGGASFDEFAVFGLVPHEADGYLAVTNLPRQRSAAVRPGSGRPIARRNGKADRRLPELRRDLGPGRQALARPGSAGRFRRRRRRLVPGRGTTGRRLLPHRAARRTRNPGLSPGSRAKSGILGVR